MFKWAMTFLFIAFFILLCLASCEYEKAITPDKEFVEVGISISIDTVKWQKE